MAPVVIDLISSPEPEEAPSLDLQTWRPRKKKEKDSTSGRLERQRDNAVSPSGRAAQSAPKTSESRTNGSRSQTSNATNASASAWGSLTVKPSNYILTSGPVTPKQHAETDSNRRQPQEGSLASLLQTSAQQSPMRPTWKQSVHGNGHWNARSPNKTSLKSSPADIESERAQMLSKFQNNHAHPRKLQPPSTAATRLASTPEDNDGPSGPSALNASHSKTPTTVKKGQPEISRTGSANSNRLLESDAIRPFKRRRLDEPSLRSPAESARPVKPDSPATVFGALLSAPGRGSSAGGIPIRSASPASSATVQTAGSPTANSDAFRVSNGSTHAHPRPPQYASPYRHKANSVSIVSKASPDSAVKPTEESSNVIDAERSLNAEAIMVNPIRPGIERPATKKAPPNLQPGKGQVGGGPYTAEDDALLIQLKEVDQLTWDEIAKRFAGSRTGGSLQVRYSTALKKRNMPSKAICSKRTILKPRLVSEQRASFSESSDAASRPVRKNRNNDVSAAEGFISWAQVKKRRMFDDSQPQAEGTESEREQHDKPPELQFRGERMHPRSLNRILRQREFALDGGRNSALTKRIPDELKEHILDNVGPSKYYKGTSGDVTCLAWAPDGGTFAAGSIAITDERSMQYNRPNNLLLGRPERNTLQELPEHHIRRPTIESDGNVNSLHSMRETQDPRLFMTVASVQFSSDGSRLYSAGSDRKVRAYNVDENSASPLYALDHAASLDLLSVNNLDVLATAAHQSTDKSIAIFKGSHRVLELSPDRKDEQSKRAIYPSALKWGSAYRHSHFLLAGFAIIDSTDDERYIAGETCLWDIQHESRIPIYGIARNVFDVAWNPSPSAGSSIFAVASSRGTGSISRGTHSVVQCFGANRRRTIGWECPALDINDVIFCKHDDNLVAAGATDGKVYVWDQRFADRSCRPLHTLAHGDTLNILDHDLDREVADTGVRFISWGGTRSRLYSGSSDGVLKVWNPYRSPEDAHVKDVTSFNSAVMSGAFSPDDRDLLIGEDQGRINLLSVGREHKAVRSMRRFDLVSAPALAIEKEDSLAVARALKRSGEISFRLMGDLPKRQAVQGPYYRGPYLRPSDQEMAQANEEYELALNAQNEAESVVLQKSRLDDTGSEALQRATKRVRDAQARVLSFQSRLDDSIALEPAAKATQRRFLLAAETRMNDTSQPVKQCSLDCNYLPAHIDDGEVPDSRQSEMRIPGLLRGLGLLSISEAATDDIAVTEKSSICISCRGVAPKPSQGKQPLCEQCWYSRNGYTASCKLCANPIRPPENGSESGLCEKCSFACFRCGKTGMVAREFSLVRCDSCRLTWQAGVLGYELIEDPRPPHSAFQWPTPNWKKKVTEELDDPNGLGGAEVEHYASKWET